MSNPMLSSWYPADLSFVELNILLRTVPTKRGTDYNLGKPTLPTPLEPPMIPPTIPGQMGNNCFMVYHKDPDTGEYPSLDLTCMIYYHPKPWNPKDPCLLRLLAEYLEKLKDIADEYKKNYRDLNVWAQKMLQTIQEQQLVCDQLCAFSLLPSLRVVCLNDCEQTAVQDSNNINQEYNRQFEYLQSAEFKARENAANVFFNFAIRQCGYSKRSIPFPLWPRWGNDPQDWFPPYWDDTYSPPDTVDTWGNPIH